MNMRTLNNTLLASVAVCALVAFENKAGWKLDADGKFVTDADGNPIYINATGGEEVVRGDLAPSLRSEAAQHRKDKETAQAELDKFKVGGKLIDPQAAVKAIETVGKIDAKTLIDAGEVDKVRETIKSEYTAQLTEKDAENARLATENKSMRVDKVFDGSEFVRERLAVPIEMFRDSFGKNVKVGDNGDIEYYGRDGNRIMSKKEIGVYAKGDEALELMVEHHPQKDMILKADDKQGSGNGGGGGGRGGGNIMKRSDFEALQPTQAAAAAGQMAKGELTLVD